MLDARDQRLLAQLQKNSRQSNQELAARVGMSPSACWRRVDSLEKAGVITRYTVLLDRAQAGFAMSAIIHVSLDRHDEKFVTQFVSRVKQRQNVSLRTIICASWSATWPPTTASLTISCSSFQAFAISGRMSC